MKKVERKCKGHHSCRKAEEEHVTPEGKDTEEKQKQTEMLTEQDNNSWRKLRNMREPDKGREFQGES